MLDLDTDVLIAVIAAVAAIAGGLANRFGDYFAARKLGMGPLRDNLVATLRDTISAQSAQITTLRAELADERVARAQLEARVQELETTLDTVLKRRRRSAPVTETPA